MEDFNIGVLYDYLDNDYRGYIKRNNLVEFIKSLVKENND